MFFSICGRLMRVVVASAACLLWVQRGLTFGLGPGPATGGHVKSPRTATSSSSFIRPGSARSGGQSGEGSPTSLGSAYVLKSEMARSRGSEWRKLRTRGPGFGEKMRRAERVPDLSDMLAEGLPYLNADEAQEVQQALAVAIYAHSLISNGRSCYEKIKAGVETCLILGELEMGTDALLSAILSGVLRPSIQPSDFGRAPVTVADIEEGFGSRVAKSVENFEHVMRLEEMAQHRMRRRVPDQEPAQKQGIYLRDLIISEATDWQVLTLHLAVHMQQLRSAISTGSSDAEQLARDALEIHAPLAHRLGIHHLSGGLEDLAFQALYPVEYDEVREATEARVRVYREVMQTAKTAIGAALQKDTAFTSQLAGEVKLQHRIKEPYSMWKKMTRQGGGVDGVFDAVALRVVLKARRVMGESDETYEERSRQLCYHAMSVAQRMYPVVEGRCKDYVQNPKPNGYQSLHSTHKVAVTPTAASGGNRLTHFELQVRSASMHHKAEYGHAAHWSYKGDEDEKLSWTSAPVLKTKKTWKAYRPKTTGLPVRGQGRSPVPESVSSGQELVTWLHVELRQRKVFVFGPDNLIWELDKASATAENVLGCAGHGLAGDAVSQSAEPSGSRCALVNGKAVPSHYAFKNGDVLDLAAAA